MLAIERNPNSGEAAVASLSTPALSLEDRARLQDMLLERLRGQRLAFTCPLWLKKVQDP
ncbi:MAG: hypothetical protein ACFBSF_17435 [Leptolyngbyaceae cyanobacterium]